MRPGDLSHLFSILILLHKMKTSSVRSYHRLSSSSSSSRILTISLERIRHLLQVAISLPRRIRHPIPWYARLTRRIRASHAKTTLADLLWTDPFRSLWNTTFKLVFIGTSAYIIYLMLNDYKPTHDPNLDTFRVQYLVAGSAVLGIVFPYKYEFSEVGKRQSSCSTGERIF
jgi:ER lumen protein retaining receptor